MKQALFIASIFLFASCSLFKRSVTDRKTDKDSTVIVAAGSISVAKEQEKRNTQTATNTHHATDSGYTRTTLTKEYFTDEFEFGEETPADNAAVPASAAKPAFQSSNSHHYFAPNVRKRQLRYRETTIAENGHLQRTVLQQKLVEKATGSMRADSTVQQQERHVNVNASEQTSAKQTQQRKLFPGWLLGSGIFLVVMLLLCWFTQKTPLQLWQSLKKRS